MIRYWLQRNFPSCSPLSIGPHINIPLYGLIVKCSAWNSHFLMDTIPILVKQPFLAIGSTPLYSQSVTILKATAPLALGATIPTFVYQL